MTARITNVNVVLAGESFPVASIRMDDFQFRGRRFTERLRVGPALSAVTKNVEMTVLPERFQVSVTDPDDIGKQMEGLREVVRAFEDYVGKRTVGHVGHNAQIIDRNGVTFAALSPRIFDFKALESILGVSDGIRAGATLEFRRGSESSARLVTARTEQDELALDFNFNFDLASSGMSVREAVDHLEASVATAQDIAGNISTFMQTAGQQA